MTPNNPETPIDPEIKLFNSDIESQLQSLGVKIENRGNIYAKAISNLYDKCNWWYLYYGHLKISVYYDPNDALGCVGQPYYETYLDHSKIILESYSKIDIGSDTERFLTSESHLFISAIYTEIEEYKIKLDTNPEFYL
jgi:hypothetical protein